MDLILEFLGFTLALILILIHQHRAHIKDALMGKLYFLTPRSGKWVTTRKHHLERQPVCQACGGKEKLNVHHIHPFHLYPEKENDEENLITLCESNANGMSCHLVWGHLGSFRSYNVHVIRDAAAWKHRVETRP